VAAIEDDGDGGVESNMGKVREVMVVSYG